MASKNSTNCMVKVTIELGHQANFLKERSTEGFTHDWTVFVRGYEGSKIEYFVEKVVFKLHKTFKMPTRVISEPPYKVTECGYAGFHLPIEIHFKNKQTPRKILFSYDLFLNAQDSPPINNIRYEKLTFQNPTPEFKAKLLKAGGTEQGSDKVQAIFPDLLGSPPKGISEKKSKSNNLNKEKHKKVKKVKKSPVRQASSESLPSLSPTSSEDELEKSPPVKERITPSLTKKESSKKESPPTDKVKAKHESSSHKTKHPGSSEKDKDVKIHKEKEKNSSSHHKDGSKKEKDSKSHKSKDSREKHKEREGSHSSSKSSSSSHGEKTSSHGDKSLSHGEKKSSAHSSIKEKPPSKEREKEKESEESNKKHKSSHKSKEKEEKSGSKHKIKESGVSLDGPTEQAKKSKESSVKSKNVSEKEKSSKPSLKRPSLSPTLDGESEKKKVKRSLSVGSEERNLVKTSNAEKEKTTNSNIITKDKKEMKAKELSKSSSSDIKSKHSRSKKLEKSKSSSHLSEDKPKSKRDNHSVERSDNNLSKNKDKPPKLTKSDSLTKAEQLAMTADFQPQLLLSPVRSLSDDENNAPSPSSGLKKRSKSNSTLNSLSSLSSSDESNKSENEEEKPQNIVSDLVDSDSDSDEEPPASKSPPKEIKPAYNNKHLSQINNKNKKVLTSPSHEKIEKSRSNDIKRHESISKSDTKGINEVKKKSNDKDGALSNSHEHVGKNGLDVLAPNGIPIGELMSINDKIERAQENEDAELINRVIDIIADTGEFDLDDSALSFDICSLEKNLVVQIQNLLRD